jgi:hypothetical protein
MTTWYRKTESRSQKKEKCLYLRLRPDSTNGDKSSQSPRVGTGNELGVLL